MFSSLHRIFCMREFLLSSSCIACTADWYAWLGALLTFCNVSCPVYLWTEHTYQMVPPDTVGWSHTSHRLSILSVFFFFIQFLVLDLNLLKDGGREGSGPLGLVLALSLASSSTVPFCSTTPYLLIWRRTLLIEEHIFGGKLCRFFWISLTLLPDLFQFLSNFPHIVFITCHFFLKVNTLNFL